jgi:hypothetical protein
MQDVRTVINNIVSDLYALVEVLEVQQKITDGRIAIAETQATQHTTVLKNIANMIDNELR